MTECLVMTHCNKTALSLQRKVLTPSTAGAAPAHTGTNEHVRLPALTGARISSEINPAVQEY